MAFLDDTLDLALAFALAFAAAFGEALAFALAFAAAFFFGDAFFGDTSSSWGEWESSMTSSRTSLTSLLSWSFSLSTTSLTPVSSSATFQDHCFHSDCGSAVSSDVFFRATKGFTKFSVTTENSRGFKWDSAYIGPKLPW